MTNNFLAIFLVPGMALALTACSFPATIEASFKDVYECPDDYLDIGTEFAICLEECQWAPDCRGFEVCLKFEEYHTPLCVQECYSDTECYDNTRCVGYSYLRWACVPEVFLD